MPRTTIAVIVLLTIFSAFMTERYFHERDAFVQYKAQVRATAEAQQRIADTVNDWNKQKAKEVASDYEKRIASIRSSYRGLYNGSASTMSCQAPTAGGADGRPSYPFLAESCAETTQQLVSLQTFVKETQ